VQVLTNTDHSVGNYQGLSAYAQGVVETALRHFSEHITRVEVHLSDEHGANHGPDDKRCVMEARVVGRPPLAATHHAVTNDAAIHGAAMALAKLIDGAFGRAARPREAHG